MLTKRIIPCLDIKNGRVVKGIKFKNHIDMGDPSELAQLYSDAGADELVFYDITASPENREIDLLWVEKVAKQISIPFSVAGGIKSLAQAKTVLDTGADKISINTPALKNPSLISLLAKNFGSQCVVIGIDAKEGNIFQNTGDPEKTQNTGKKLLDWVLEAQNMGAGEIVLNSINSDGTKNGYDIKNLKLISTSLKIPIIASGGAGNMEHFFDVFSQTNVSGALAASVFHSGEIKVPDLKKFLQQKKICVR